MTIALDAGASDFSSDKDAYEITTEPQDYEAVKKAVDDAKIPTQSAEVTKIPQNTIKLSAGEAKTVLGLMDAIEEHEDVQKRLF